MSAARIFILASRTWLAVDAAGMIVARGEAAKASAARTVLVIPGAEVTVRWVALKAAGIEQAAAAAALMLEDEVSAPRESLHFAAGETDAAGRRCVAIITRARMQALLDEARALGCAPAAVVPDCLMLPKPDAGLIAAEIGGMVAVRGREIAFTAEPELAEHLAGGRTMEMAAAEGLIAAGAAAGAPVNLLQGAFGAGAKTAGTWRLAAVLAGLAILSPVVVEGAYAVRDRLEGDRIRRVANEQMQATAVRLGVPPKTAFLLAGSIGAGERFTKVMAGIFSAAEGMPGARLQTVTYDHRSGAIGVEFTHENYSDTAAFSSALKARGFGVREDGSTEAGGVISTGLMLAAPR